ncbi:N-acetylmuramoyl-L-alanine amidase-like domain-containing protein [Hoylesella oralis]|jgi:Protein of unknown function (DUF1460).|uniref:N-acetylmuramoyl-L-alanine amidase-like domain-containing protein n=1 Tax=Hoylesella oralis TaxID=28134 RepID=UPI0028E853B4|nr:N-acetylmuramoyl-L-alanine amidase-like domain-containing protein [Hoylesella oralis]
MKTIVFSLFLSLICTSHNASAQIQYTKRDSIIAMNMLHKAISNKQKENLFLFFAREFKGTPYVAQTLERNEKEKLIVNLREVDCTTYIEYVLALTLCYQNKKNTFIDFCNYLQHVRYIDGHISYLKRQHYFTIWIEDNCKSGFVKEIQTPDPPFTKLQTISINYMTVHPDKYPMLVKHREWIDGIAKLEEDYNGKEYRYIPKTAIANTRLFRNTVHDGDILALVTSRKGLDTTHIGIAVWHKDGLHLLHASSIRGKVVEEITTLKTYMQKHPSQIGIRVIRVLP